MIFLRNDNKNVYYDTATEYDNNQTQKDDNILMNDANNNSNISSAPINMITTSNHQNSDNNIES